MSDRLAKNSSAAWFRAALALATGVVAAGLAGCSSYDVHVNGFAQNGAEFGKTYTIISGINGTTEGDLQFQEAAAYLQTALTQRGYTRPADPNAAALGMLLGYGIGPPQTRVTSYPSPIWGGAGGYSTVTTQGKGGKSSTTVVYGPALGIVGYNSNVSSYSVYTKSLTVAAVDLRAYRNAKQIKEFWKTEVYTTTNTQDIRRTIPILIAAAAPYFGTNTGKEVDVTLAENSPAVQALTGPGKTSP
jgi:Domain of unknown function (DUF4136)